MSKKQKQDNEVHWLDEKHPFESDEEMEILIFTCIDCGKEDEVPDFVVDDFAIDLRKGEEVEILCPFCEGTMRRARNVPSD